MAGIPFPGDQGDLVDGPEFGARGDRTMKAASPDMGASDFEVPIQDGTQEPLASPAAERASKERWAWF